MKRLACLLLLAGCTGSSSNNNNSMPDLAGGALPDLSVGSSSQGITLKSDTFKVPAGGEVFMCQEFKNPFGGVDTDVQRFTSHMTPGSHHLLFFYSDKNADVPATACSGLEFSPTPYGAQSPDAEVLYPDGVGALVKGAKGFRLNMHYVNASQSDLMAQVTVTMYPAKAGSVTQHAGLFFFNNVFGVNIPAGQMKTISASCTFNKDVNILYGLAHMHKYSLSMTATVNGQTIYTTDSWDKAPLLRIDPPLAVKATDKVTWASVIDNTSGTTLTFGESAMTNEMSIFDGQYYPADPDNPTIECMK